MSVPHMAGLVFSKWVSLNPEPISTARHHDDQGDPFQVDISLLSRLWQVSFQEPLRVDPSLDYSHMKSPTCMGPASHQGKGWHWNS